MVAADPEMARSVSGGEGFTPSVYNGNTSDHALACECLDCKQKRKYQAVVTDVKHLASLKAPEFDVIAKPAQYNQGKIEVWDFLIDQDLNFLAANVIKYICRYRFKGSPLQDLKKARAYLDKLISTLEAET